MAVGVRWPPLPAFTGPQIGDGFIPSQQFQSHNLRVGESLLIILLWRHLQTTRGCLPLLTVEPVCVTAIAQQTSRTQMGVKLDPHVLLVPQQWRPLQQEMAQWEEMEMGRHVRWPSPMPITELFRVWDHFWVN